MQGLLKNKNTIKRWTNFKRWSEKDGGDGKITGKDFAMLRGKKKDNLIKKNHHL
jgi:hypothetical protein